MDVHFSCLFCHLSRTKELAEDLSSASNGCLSESIEVLKLEKDSGTPAHLLLPSYAKLQHNTVFNIVALCSLFSKWQTCSYNYLKKTNQKTKENMKQTVLLRSVYSTKFLDSFPWTGISAQTAGDIAKCC